MEVVFSGCWCADSNRTGQSEESRNSSEDLTRTHTRPAVVPLYSLVHMYNLQWCKEEEEQFKAGVVEAYDREGSAYYSTGRLWDDGVIDPADTRKVLGLCLAAASMNRTHESTRYGVFRM